MSTLPPHSHLPGKRVEWNADNWGGLATIVRVAYIYHGEPVIEVADDDVRGTITLMPWEYTLLP